MSYEVKGNTLSHAFRSSVLSLALCGLVPNTVFANNNETNTQSKKDDQTLLAENPKWEFDLDPDGIEGMYRFNPSTLITTYSKAKFDKISYEGIAFGVRAYHRFDNKILAYGGFERFDGQNKFNMGVAYEDVNYTFNGGEAKFIDRRFFGIETAFRSRDENTLKISYTYEHDFSDQASRVFGNFGNNMTREYGVFAEGRDKDWDMGATVGVFKPLRFKFRDSTSYWHIGVVGQMTMDEGTSLHLVARKGRRIDGTISFSEPRLGVR